MRMSVDERITTILVDTCAFRDANSDFIGISSMLLPSFFSVIKEKDKAYVESHKGAAAE